LGHLDSPISLGRRISHLGAVCQRTTYPSRG
jgi:hypothetical protein